MLAAMHITPPFHLLFFISGEDAYGYAALKSLPLRDENISPTARPEGSNASNLADDIGGDKAIAKILLGQCSAMLDGKE